MSRKDSEHSWGKLKSLEKIFLSETNSWTSKSRHLAQCVSLLLAQNGSTFSLEEALAFMFCTFVSFNAARETFTGISFVMLLTEPSVKESDSNRKDQIYPCRTATYDASWSFLLVYVYTFVYITRYRS